ncbi:MAG: WG repeat-containing protein [Bacteroidota bacterium]
MKTSLTLLIYFFAVSFGYSQVDNQEEKILMDAPVVPAPVPKYKKGDTILIKDVSHRFIKSRKGLFVLKENEKIGVFDSKLNPILIPANWQAVKIEDYGIEVVTNDGKCGLYNKEGKELIPPIMKYVTYVYEGLFRCTNEDGKIHFYFLDKDYYTRTGYCDVREFEAKSFRLLVSPDCKNYGLVHLDSIDHVATFDFQKPDYISLDKKSGCILTKDNKRGAIFYDHTIILPFEYEEIKKVRDGFMVKKNNLGGVVDEKNQELIPIKYESIELLNSEGQFLVGEKNKIGLINIDNEILIPVEYEELQWNYRRNLFYATKDGKKGVVGADGGVDIPIVYDFLKDNSTYGYVVASNGKAGVMSYDGEEIVPIKFYQVNFMRADKKYGEAGYHVLNKNMKSAFFNVSGEPQTDFVFDEYEIQGISQPAKVKIGETEFYVNAHGTCVKECPPDSFLKEYGLKSKCLDKNKER